MISLPYGPKENYVPLHTFLESHNHHHPMIKFTFTWSAKEVVFLDTRAYFKNNQIKTDLYVQPTDQHQYLCLGTCHPKHCETAIPYIQAFHLQRICLEEETFLKKSVLDTPREACVQPKLNQEKSAHTPLVVTSRPRLPSFHLTTE